MSWILDEQHEIVWYKLTNIRGMHLRTQDPARSRLKTVRTLQNLENPAHTQRNRTASKYGNDYMVVDSGTSEIVISDVNLSHVIVLAEEVEMEHRNGTLIISEYRSKVLIGTGRITVTLNLVFRSPTLHMEILSCHILDAHGITNEISERMCLLANRAWSSWCLEMIFRVDDKACTPSGLYGPLENIVRHLHFWNNPIFLDGSGRKRKISFCTDECDIVMRKQ